jgi:signal transduction histidine kinase
MNMTSVNDPSQRVFFRMILAASSQTPLLAFQGICDAWRQSSGALWAWLWLYNEYRKHFELFAISPKGGQRPEQFITPDKTSVCYETLLTARRLIHVADVSSYEGQAGSRVAYGPLLRSLNSPTYDSVPLIDYDGRPLGVLTLHYDAGHPGMVLDPSIIELMFQASAGAIRHSFQTENLRTLALLNQHTNDALANPYRPEHARVRYVTNLIQLIRDRTNAAAVSVFYRGATDETIFECVGSTGLRDAKSGEYIDPAAVTVARYRLGENRTGKCIQDNAPKFVEADSSEPRYMDRDMFQADVVRGPVLLFPIPSVTGAPPAAGVIRCGHHVPPLFPQAHRSFDAIEIEALRFIADQAAVVLAVCATRIRRERLVLAVKHDLETPLRLIANSAEYLKEELSSKSLGDDIGEAIDDLEVCSLLARNLTSQLGSATGDSPADRRAASPSRVDVDECLTSLVAVLGRFARHFGLQVVLTGRLDVEARIDKLLFERAVCNLIVNAVQNANAGSTITVEVMRDVSGDARVEVANAGSLGEDAASHLFEFGYSARRLRGGPGSGVGLWAAKEAMRAHEGDVEFVSSAEGNVRFAVRLPALIMCENKGE